MTTCKDSNCVEKIVQRLLKVAELAMAILWSVCYLYRDRAALQEVNKENGVTKVLLAFDADQLLTIWSTNVH